jgi:hypothetical protein
MDFFWYISWQSSLILVEKTKTSEVNSGLQCRTAGIILFCTIFLLASSGRAADRQFVGGHLPQVLAKQQPISYLDPSGAMDVSIGLPLRNREGLTNLLQGIYQPGNPLYHHFLRPDEFTAQFGPSQEDYQSVIDFAQSNHLTVTKTHAGRTYLLVRGTVGDIEKAFHIRMGVYQHPTENRTFYAPDAQPSLDLQTPVLTISGLNNYTIPHPLLRKSLNAQPQTGSGPGQAYIGTDFRAAYVPGVSLDGTGQSVDIFELDGYVMSDITNYESLASITNRPTLTNVLIDGYNGATAGGGLEDVEVCLDIEMVISMAPAVSNIYVYEGGQTVATIINDLLGRMADDDNARQITSSWSFDIDAFTDQIFQQMAVQGQSVFFASGDTDAYTGTIPAPSDDPNITMVGGTSLSTAAAGGAWQSERVWNDGDGVGSSGGISSTVPIPLWQQGINMTTNKGSTNFRNLPDVALTGANVYVQVGSESGTYEGTSCAAPLWAGFMSLVNQQASLNGQPPLGFINPAIYAIGKGTNYNNAFHDITVGNNFSSSSPASFPAEPGYDLCTGWGTPTGSNMIAALLAPQDPLAILPELGFIAKGHAGGPFDITFQTYTLSNAGAAPLNWNLVNTNVWLTASPTNGALSPGSSTTVTVSLNSNASNYLILDLAGSIFFTNQNDGVAQGWPFTLRVGNGGFEDSELSFSNWTQTGSAQFSFPVALDDGSLSSLVTGADASQFVHSGLYGAFLGQGGSLGSLFQMLPTINKQYYFISAWFTSVASSGHTTPNQFEVKWNNKAIYNQSNLGAFGWSNLVFLEQATASSTPLEIDYRNDPAAFGLDDVSVQTLPSPVFQSVSVSHSNVVMSWASLPGLQYKLQYATNSTNLNWKNVVSSITATSSLVTATDTNPPNPQRFYRFIVGP